MVITPLSTQRLTGIAKRLVADNLLAAEAATKAQADALIHKEPLVAYLVQHKLVNARQLALALADEFGVPFADLDAIEMSLTPTKLVDEKLIRRHHIYPCSNVATAYFWPWRIPRICRHWMTSNSIPVRILKPSW